MKIAITNLGGSIKFKEDSLKRSDGTLEYYNLIYALLRNEKIENLFILQRSDWDRVSSDRRKEIDPRGILVDVHTDKRYNIDYKPTYEQVFTKKDNKEYRRVSNIEYSALYEAIKDEGIDVCLGFLSYALTRVNIPHKIKKQDKEGYYSCLESTILYLSPQVWYLNESKVPWFGISTDPRYVNEKMVFRDLTNIPLKIISQYNQTLIFNYIKEYPHQGEVWKISEKPSDLFYSGIEKLNLLNSPIENKEKENLFSIASMQSSPGGSKNDYRFNELEKWICKSKRENISIFGKWDDFYSKRYPEYFKGLLPYQELDEHFSKTKYTLIIPIGKNWVTSKWCEMLRLGVIPFFHPDYDTQNNVFPVDSFLRVKSPEDMWKKIEILESKPGERDTLIYKLQEKYLSDVKSGKFIFSMLNSLFDEFNLDLKLNESLEQIKIEKNELF